MTDSATHVTHDELVSHYYGEDAADVSRVASHLRACASCQASLDRLRHTLALVDTADEGEPHAGYEARSGRGSRISSTRRSRGGAG